MTGAEGINFVTVRIDDNKCNRCYECIDICPTGALSLEQSIFIHSAYECNYEKECEKVCKNNAITILDM